LIDTTFVLAYIALLVVLGWRTRLRGKTEADEFLVAGRHLSLPAFVATLVSTWYGGILGVGEYSYSYGLSNWLVFGVPYYLYAVVFALFLAGRARRARLYTIPDQLDRAYGRSASIAGAFFVFITSIPAAYVLMLGLLLQVMFGWPLTLGVVLGALFSLFYVYLGGLRSVVRTDLLQFGLMFGGFAVLLPLAAATYGGFGFLKANLPASHFTWHGGNPPQYIFVWYVIAASTLVEPAFYQRCFAARDEGTARRGILLSVLFWICFDFLTTFTGLYARASLSPLDNAALAYPALASQLLPAVLKGLFLVGMLATVMSTIDSYSFVSALTIGRDFIWRLRREPAADRLPFYTRLGLLLSAAAAVGLALWSQSVVDLWHDLGSLTTPALLVPLAASFSSRHRLRPRWALACILASAGITGFWMLTKSASLLGGAGHYLLGIEPIYVGLAVSLGFFLLDRVTRSRASVDRESTTDRHG